MPSPTLNEVRVNQLLTDISLGYLQDDEGFAHLRCFPLVQSRQQSGLIGRYDRADWWRNNFAKRAGGAESAGSGWKQDNTMSYFADVWALHKDITRQDEANAQNPYDLRRDATLWLMEQAKISREVEWAARYFTTGKWTGIDGTLADMTGVNSGATGNQFVRWNVANSTPIKDIRAKMDTIHKLIGKRPNKLVLGREVWTVLADHADVLARIINSGGVSPSAPAKVLRQALASILELDEVVVMDGIQVTSAENSSFETSKTTSFIAGKNALLVRAEPNASLMNPSAGMTFAWTGYEGGAGGQGQVISDFWIQEKKVTRVEAEMAYAFKLTQTDGGVFFSTAVA